MLGDDSEWTVGGAMRGYGPSEQAANLKLPVLITVGRYDRIMPPRVARELKAALKSTDAELAVFERSGHRPWLEEFDAYFPFLKRFLSRAVI